MAIWMVLVLCACRSAAPVPVAKDPTGNSIVFLSFNMQHDSLSGRSTLVLLDKKQVEGTIKGKEQASMITGNYLAIHVYHSKKLADSLIIDHPLYKHFEYLDEHNKFMVKDTVLTQADFSVRLQVQGASNSIRVYEMLRGQAKTQLAIIEL